MRTNNRHQYNFYFISGIVLSNVNYLYSRFFPNGKTKVYRYDLVSILPQTFNSDNFIGELWKAKRHRLLIRMEGIK